MILFRIFLTTILTVIAVYTAVVVANHGLNLLPIFFGDMLKMEWPGQFNLDFFGFLLMSAFWTAWRNRFTARGWGLALLALFFGAPFLTTYLLFLSFQTQGDIQAMLVGAQGGTSKSS